MPSGLQFVLASPANEPQLRKLLRDNPVGGTIRIALEREPDAFRAAAVSGDRYELILAYAENSDVLLGAGARFELDAYVNGAQQRLGYLGELRIQGGLKQRRTLLVEAYRALRRFHEAGTARFYLTTIIADNTPTRRLLEAGLADMPTYQPLESMVTFTIPSAAGARRRSASRNVAGGAQIDLADVAARLAKHGPDYQFHPVWSEESLRSPGRCRDLAPQDFFLCSDGDQPVGCLALWDQRNFKQTVIRGYAARLARLRPLANFVAPLLGRPRLPAPGARLESAFLSHVAVAADDTETLVALIGEACREALRRGLDYVMLAFAERNPLAAAIRNRFPCHSYVSMIYVVYWDDGASAAAHLDARVPHPEVAVL